MIAAFQWDLGRQVERLDWLVAQLPRYADWGYRELYLKNPHGWRAAGRSSAKTHRLPHPD